MLADGRKVIVVIPAYNEEGRIPQALMGMPPVVDLPLLVDDGSADRTAEVARQHGATVISLRERGGLAGAIRAGFDVAQRDSYDIIVVMAGNGKDDPREITRLLEPIEKNNVDFVQGSRYLSGGRYGKMPIHRVLGTRLYPWLVRLTTGFPATDGTNGFRAFKASILRDPRIQIHQTWLDPTGLEFYLALKVIQLGYSVVEVPVTKLYPATNRYRAYTKVKPLKDWWNILKPVVYLTLRLRT
jgi:dolichol-phosphate mannosyltransferase